MLSPFTINDKALILDRFPPKQVNRDLQAWDSADELLIEYLSEELNSASSAKIALFNDSFGALSLALHSCHVTSYSDSFVSHQGIKYNLQKNQLNCAHLTLKTCNDTIVDSPDWVVVKVPKNLSLLQWQLSQLAQVVTADTHIVAGARLKELTPTVFKLFESYLGPVTTSLAKKKSRLLFCQPKVKQHTDEPHTTQWPLENTPYQLTNRANVFAREKLDIGARVFIDNLPQLAPNQRVIDLGCGNGVIGLMCLHQQPQIHCLFIDESYLAVATARDNIVTNLGETMATEHCEFRTNDCLTGLENDSVDTIVCNPPFHQQTAITDHIAWQMFKDSVRVLKKGGELRIVGNRQLGYHIKLQRLFGNCTTIASNKKFVILSAIKN